MNNDINLPVEWQESLELPYEGLYFIAARYPNGFGIYDLAEWNGEKWDLGYTAEVVGWVTIDNFMGVINAGWPKGDDKFYKGFAEQYQKYKAQKKDTDSGEDDFIEVR
jgi:hypothetical protein